MLKFKKNNSGAKRLKKTIRIFLKFLYLECTDMFPCNLLASWGLSFCLSHTTTQLPLDRYLLKKKIYFTIFLNSVDKIQVSLNSDKKRDTLQQYLCESVTASDWILLRMRNVSVKSCREYQNTFNVQYTYVRKISKSQAGHRWHFSAAHARCKATDTHSQYVTLIARLQTHTHNT